MDEPFSDFPDDDESPEPIPREDSPDDRKNKQPESLSNEIFTIKISEEMSIRNALRTGLVEAQGKDTGKMPMFVSWPGWLDDGIVCMYARDLHELLNKAVKDSAISFGKTFEIEDKKPESEINTNEDEAEFEPLSLFESDEENKLSD
ncbi:hypothetical protein ACFL6H_02170 [Candidatus Latescibacterota bacterium]